MIITPPVGIEPTTSRLEVSRATNCAKRALSILIKKIKIYNLIYQITHKISQTGFEPVTDGVLEYRLQSIALPTELSRDYGLLSKMTITLPTGIEPVTSRLTVECSNRLS